MFHTLGQRQGLGIGGRRDSNGAPWFVVGKDLARNALLVVQGSDHPALLHSRLRALQPHWIAGEPPPLPLACRAKIRYRQPDQACILETLDANALTVHFAEPQRAITPGQSVVFYQDDLCLGGAVIEAASD